MTEPSPVELPAHLYRLVDLDHSSVLPAYTGEIGKSVRAAMKDAEPRALQADVADWLQLSQGAVWKRLEGHTPWTVGELIVVAERLGMPIETLLAGIGELAA